MALEKIFPGKCNNMGSGKPALVGDRSKYINLFSNLIKPPEKLMYDNYDNDT